MNNETDRENDRSLPGPLVVRTLKDPPEIWDLVPQVSRAFNPGGAFVAHLSSNKTKLVMLTLAVVVLSGVCLFAVTTLREARNRAGAAAQMQDEPGTSQAVPATQASAPADPQLNNQLNTSPGAAEGVNNTPPQSTVPQPGDPKANPASSDQAVTSSVQPTSESVRNSSRPTASSVNKRALASGKTGNSPRVRRDNETAGAPDTSAAPQTRQGASAAGVKAKSFEKSSDDSAPGKRSDKPLTPPPTGAPGSSTPNANTSKPKVIQWP